MLDSAMTGGDSACFQLVNIGALWLTYYTKKKKKKFKNEMKIGLADGSKLENWKINWTVTSLCFCLLLLVFPT